MDREARISYASYFDVVQLLEPRWRIVQVGGLYHLQYKNRKLNGWGREPRGNESKSIEKIIEVYETRVRQRDPVERNKIQHQMHVIWLEDGYKRGDHIELSKGLFGDYYLELI